MINVIQELHPEVVVVRNGVAFDSNENVVEYDLALVNSKIAASEYQRKRLAEYPPMADYIDGIVKGDQSQVQAYIDACLAIKAKYPKPTE
jgi:hypothetical protein